jgi:hypothetical protein
MANEPDDVARWIASVLDNEPKVNGISLTWRQRRDWTRIASEVRLRKTLILRAAEDLSTGITDVENRGREIFLYPPLREGPSKPNATARLRAATDSLGHIELSPGERPPEKIRPNPLVMSATDVFVEKAQLKLSQRAGWFGFLGAVISGVIVALLIGAAWTLLQLNFESALHTKEVDAAAHPGMLLTLVLVRSLTISALFLGGVYLLVMLARALLHEAMVSIGRRHSLRFGRLYVYAKLGHVDFNEMRKAFEWSLEHKSAFADIRGDKVSKTLVQAIADVAKEVAKSTASAITEAAKAKNATTSE